MPGSLKPVPDPTWRECVAQWRLRLGLTKQDLAEKCGLSRVTLWRIESGKQEPTQEQIDTVERAIMNEKEWFIREWARKNSGNHWGDSDWKAPTL